MGRTTLCRELRRLPLMAAAAVLIGCASTETALKEPSPRQDFLEYRRMVVRAVVEVDATLRAVDEVSVQADRNPRAAYLAFAKAVHRLEVDSIKVRPAPKPYASGATPISSIGRNFWPGWRIRECASVLEPARRS